MSTGRIFLERARYFLSTEYRTQLRLAVEALPEDGLWWRANDQSNSVGNLLLHLNGNVRQWILAGIGGQPDIRHRAGEFEARSGQPASALLADLDRTLDDVDVVLADLTEANLLEPRTIQGRDVTVLAAVFHVVEHFSQHLGQIIFIAKLLAPGAIAFHEDAAGLARPLWEAKIGR